MNKLTPRSLLEQFGRGTHLAAKLGVQPSAISNWLSAGRIPPGRWPDLIELAERDGIEGITFEILRAAHSGESAKAA